MDASDICEVMVWERSGGIGPVCELIVCERPGGGAAPKMDEKAASRWNEDAWP